MQAQVYDDSAADAESRLRTDNPDEGKSVVVDEPLSERAQHGLIAMLEFQAFDSDQRRTTEEIAAKALGAGADANALKNVMSELKTREYLKSRTGRGGGCWLTEKGRARAEKLRNH